MRIPLLAVSIACLAAGTPVMAERPPGVLEPGTPFPDLLLPAMEGGRPMSVSQFRGQRIALHIFASW